MAPHRPANRLGQKVGRTYHLRRKCPKIQMGHRASDTDFDDCPCLYRPGARVLMVARAPAGSAPSDCVVPHSRLAVARARLLLSVGPRQPGRPASSTPFLRISTQGRPRSSPATATADRDVAGELDERAFEDRKPAPPARASLMVSAAIAEAGAPSPGSHRQLFARGKQDAGLPLGALGFSLPSG